MSSGRMSPASLPIPTNSSDELLAESSDAGAWPSPRPNAPRCSTLATRAQDRRKRAIDLYTRAKLSDTEFDAVAADVERELNRRSMSGWPISNPIRTLPTTPSPRMCWRRSVSGWRTTYRRPSAARSFSCSCAGSPSTPRPRQRPQAGPSRHRLPLPACSPNSHGHRCESQLQSPPRYRRLRPNSFILGFLQLQRQTPVSPSSSFPS